MERTWIKNILIIWWLNQTTVNESVLITGAHWCVSINRDLSSIHHTIDVHWINERARASQIKSTNTIVTAENVLTTRRVKIIQSDSLFIVRTDPNYIVIDLWVMHHVQRKRDFLCVELLWDNRAVTSSYFKTKITDWQKYVGDKSNGEIDESVCVCGGRGGVYCITNAKHIVNNADYMLLLLGALFCVKICSRCTKPTMKNATV